LWITGFVHNSNGVPGDEDENDAATTAAAAAATANDADGL